MSARRPPIEADTAERAEQVDTPARVARPTGTSITAGRMAGPNTRNEAEEQYVAARNAWTMAMRAASSGRPADLASLAITQEAYEAAAAERGRWISGERVALQAKPPPTQRSVDAAVGQELAWRRVRESDGKAPGMLGRLARKLRGR